MKVTIEIPDELISAALAPQASPATGAADQPLSGGAAPEAVAVQSIPLASAERPISAGPAEQVASVIDVSQQRVTALDGGAAPG
jgi:hypothetical protein